MPIATKDEGIRWERFARAMCISDGNDPDQRVFRGEPQRVNGVVPGYVVPTVEYTQLAWTLYLGYAQAVDDELLIIEPPNGS